MRGCDGCTVCCKVMGVTELGKPGDTRCPHCVVAQGCTIYDSRPKSCRTFECVWLQTQRSAHPMPLALRPDRSRVVIDTTNGGRDIVLNVSRERPDAWRRGSIAELVTRLRADGFAVFVKCGDALERV